jgi:hypothetical protein
LAECRAEHVAVAAFFHMKQATDKMETKMENVPAQGPI